MEKNYKRKEYTPYNMYMHKEDFESVKKFNKDKEQLFGFHFLDNRFYNRKYF